MFKKTSTDCAARKRKLSSRRRDLRLGQAAWTGLECLEQRVLMSVYTVSNPNDNGQVNELRWAVNQADNDPNGTIVFSSIPNNTITLNPALGALDLSFGGNTVINGTGITINGDGQTQIFNSYIGDHATLNGLTLTDGNASNANGTGGAIYNQGYLNLVNCTLTDDVASNGGAVFNRGGDVTLVGCTLNTDSAGSGGGAIDNALGNMSITNTSISNDTASNGGGILNYGTIYAINNCQINGDSSTSNGGGITNNGRISQIYGGTTFTNDTAPNDGGGIFSANSIVINNCTFTSDVSSNGGGLNNQGNSSNATLNNDTFTSDQSNHDGGGIYNNGTINLNNTVIQGCTATSFGGGFKSDGVASFNNCLITGNQTFSGGLGGGIINGPGDVMHISNSTLSFNVSQSGGGGLENAGNASLLDDKIYGNDCTGDAGGGVRGRGSVTSIVGCNVFDNTSLTGGGGIAIISGIGKVSASFVYNNTTTQGNGGGISFAANNQGTISFTSVFLNVAQYSGGGVYMTGDNLISNCNIYDNTAMQNYGGGVFLGGGGTLINVQVNNNRALSTSGSGGGLFSNGNTSISFGSTFSGNYAGNAGGGVELAGGTLIAAGITISGDTAGQKGGGIFTSNYSTTLTSCVINGDGAVNGAGGGVYDNGSQFTIVGSTLQNDSAASGAGGIEARGQLTVINSLLQNDSLTSASSTGAGAIYAYSGASALIAGDTITGNSAPGGVGGILNQSGNTANVYNSILWNDTGGETGGSSAIVSAYSDIQGSAQVGGDISGIPDFVGNGSFQLLFNSPCVNTGSNALIQPLGSVTDLAGKPRVADGTVDMGAYEAQIICVDSQANGLNNGTSWGNAYKSLSAAITAAQSGQIIEVGGAGPYSPGSTPASTFQLKNGVTILGGFAGTGAPNPDLRNTVTVLTGAYTGGNNYHVVSNGVNSIAVLDGFTISGGDAVGGGFNADGAGIYDSGGSLSVNNCIITSNTATAGGGIYVTGTTLNITNSTVKANVAVDGSGIYQYNSTLNLTNCQIINSTATFAGGGIYAQNGTLNALDTTFGGDSAPQNGGGIYGNNATVNATNSIFVLDAVTSYGGSAVGLIGGRGQLTNDTLTDNSLGGPDGGAIVYGFDVSTLNVTNSIVWNDATYVNNGTGSEFNVTWGNYSSGTFAVSYSDVLGGFTGIGNISVNPGFNSIPVAPSNFGVLTLVPNSPAINAGSNAAVPNGIGTDIAGNPRIVDGTVDMGAYERSPIYVDAGAPGGNGSSWTNAYTSLTTALTAAQNIETQYPGAQIAIEISQGMYSPGVSAGSSFHLLNNVSIYGGFAGYGTANQDSRNLTLFPTILSGGGVNNHVVTGSGTNATALLDGVIITGGNANGTGVNAYGGGIYDLSGSPTINNCIIAANSAAGRGGGMYNASSSPTLTNDSFNGNTSAGGDGGGMYNVSSPLALTNCTFFANSADYGGAMYNSISTISINNCSINGNSASSGGGGIYETTAATITRTSFNGNTATFGAGAIDQTGGTLNVNNSIFAGDSLGSGLGGSAILVGGSSVSQITNDTFTDDSFGGAAGGGVIYGQNVSSLNITNSIFWNDSTYVNTGTGSEFNVTWGNYSSGTFAVNYSDVQGGFSGPGNINIDPQFVRGPNLNVGDYGNLELQTTSHAIGAGLNSANTSAIDFAGNTRIYPSGGTIDMGAYEYQGTPLTTIAGMVIGYENVDYPLDTVPDSVTVMLNQNATLPTLSLFTTNGISVPFQVTAGNDASYVLTFPSSLSSQYVNNALPAGQYMLEVGPSSGSLNAGTEYYLFNSPQTINRNPTVVLGSAPSTVTTKTAQLSVIGNDPTGNHEPLSYTYSMVSGPAQVLFSDPYTNNQSTLMAPFSTVTATFSQAGPYVISVIATDIFGTSTQLLIDINVVATLNGLQISPMNPGVQLSTPTLNTTQQFTATGADQFGNPMTVPSGLIWSCVGDGSIDPTSGLYTAPQSGSSATITATVNGIISTPSVITLLQPMSAAATSTGLVTINWSADSGNFAYYTVFRDVTPGFAISPYNMIVNSTSATSFDDDTVAAGTTYYYEVYAISSTDTATLVGQSMVQTPTDDVPLDDQPAVPAGGLQPAASIPITPTNVLVTGVNDLEMLVCWTYSPAHMYQTGFEVQVTTDATFATGWYTVGDASAASRNFLIRGWGPNGANFLTEGQNYYVRVDAFNKKGASGFSTPTGPGQVLVPLFNIDLGQDIIAIVGGNNQPLDYLLSGVTVNQTNGALQGTGNSVGAIWVHDVAEGYNAFLTSDPHDGGSVGSGAANSNYTAHDGTSIECALNNDGSGRFYDEIIYELNHRYNDIGLIGYSHGGGMIYNISNRLFNDTLPPLASVIFVATIDAVEYDPNPDAKIGLYGWYDSNPLLTSPAIIWAAQGFNYWEPSGYDYLGSLWSGHVRGANLPGVTNHEEDGDDHSQIAVDTYVLNDVELQTDNVFF